MASDRQQYRRAVDAWKSKQELGHFSVEPEDGIIAILSATFPYNLTSSKNQSETEKANACIDDEEDRQEFNSEANQLAVRLGEVGLKTEIFIDADIYDVTDVANDRQVSDVIFIGHGSLSDIYLKGAPQDRLDWRQVSVLGNHLKRGTITQRQCGIARRNANIPLGTFMVSDLSNVRAAYGIIFTPIDLDDKVNRLVRPVFEMSEPPGYLDIVDIFSEDY